MAAKLASHGARGDKAAANPGTIRMQRIADEKLESKHNWFSDYSSSHRLHAWNRRGGVSWLHKQPSNIRMSI